jgi:glycosyltransferase involved in cell wall biosynthesis
VTIDVSVVIPVYKEPLQELKQNIAYMREQTVYKQGRMEIVLAYVPDASLPMGKVINPNHKNIRAISVDRGGIAYGRHVGVNHSQGRAIVNFDADGYLAPESAVEKLTRPILEGRAHLTCCDNLFDIRNLTPAEVNSIDAIIKVNETLNQMQQSPLFACLEPGMCFSKQAYNYVGGFSDVRQYEGAFLAAKIITAYTPVMKQWVDGVKAVVSARRALHAAKWGILQAYGNYTQTNPRTSK